MRNTGLKSRVFCICFIPLFCLLFPLLSDSLLYASDNGGEVIYKSLSRSARDTGGAEFFNKLLHYSRGLDWSRAEEQEFTGNLRLIKAEKHGGEVERLYLIRKLSGEIYILAVPEYESEMEKGPGQYYRDLDRMLENKMVFSINILKGDFKGRSYLFARLTAKPYQLLLDRIFKICIVLMLFFVMVGMGLTLTVKDFALVFIKPGGIILGEVLQFGIMPLVAFGIGHLMGFYENYPFIFIGMILITAIPGGVTSNLMTYYAKGDLALSISMTSFSTVLSLIFTPLILGLYCANVPDVTIPVKIVVQTILILVIIPLVIGMSVRAKWEEFAKKATPFFSALGIIALLFLIIAGILSNLHIFSDTERHGFAFYSMVFSLTFLGMFFGVVMPKIFRISNYQTRAISLESGLRNASLAMAIALLIQDFMGDFHSSMFAVSGIFGLTMYIAGLIAILFYKKVLPVDDQPDEGEG